MKRWLVVFSVIALLAGADTARAQQNPTIPLPKIGIDIGASDNPEDVGVTLQILLLLTVLSLAPSIIIMTTSYLRIIIVLHFLRNAMGTMQMPPTQLLAGVALFITMFIMWPTWTEVADTAVEPLMNDEITMDSAYTTGIEPIREFMFRHVRDKDLELFMGLALEERPENREDLGTHILIPAYVLSELRAAFFIGFFLFIPFLVIDMVVASILMAMGMMMLPPILISLPFKILLFVLVDGWNLVIGSLIRSFNL